jgi:hypothetical protein
LLAGVKAHALQWPEERCPMAAFRLQVAPPMVSHQAPVLLRTVPHLKLAALGLPYNVRNVGSFEISSHQCKR